MFNSNIRKKLSIVLVTILIVNTFFGVYGNNIDLVTNSKELEVSNYERENLELEADESVELMGDDFSEGGVDNEIVIEENNIDYDENLNDKEDDEAVEDKEDELKNEISNSDSEKAYGDSIDRENDNNKDENLDRQDKEDTENIEEDEKSDDLNESEAEKESIENEMESKESENETDKDENSIDESENETNKDENLINESENATSENSEETSNANNIIVEDEVATASDISFYGRSDSVLSFMSQFEKKDYDYKDGVLNIYSDLVFNESFVITEDIEINLNEKTIKGEMYATLMTIKNSNVTIKNGSVIAREGDSGVLDGSNCIELYDSNLTIDNAKIYGGDGYSIKEDIEKPGNGGVAIYGEFTDNKYSIIFNSGAIEGGNGGNGYEGDVRAFGGEGIIINDIEFNPSAYEHTIARGLIGDFGCGNGGDAIKVNGEVSEENILVNDIGIKGGSAGKCFSNKKRRLKTVKYGSELPEAYDSRDEGLVTPLKDQEDTALCATFTICAVAETNIIKNYPDYIRSLGIYENLTDFDLSEVSEGYFYLNPPEDKMGMIKNEEGTAQDVHGRKKYSSVLYNYKKNSAGEVTEDWYDWYANQYDHYIYGSSFRSFQAEEVLRWKDEVGNKEYKQSFFDEELTQNQLVHLKNTEHFYLGEYNDYSEPFSAETFSYEGIERIKRAVVKNGAVGLGIRGEGSSGYAPESVGRYTYNGISKPYSVINAKSNSSSVGGHMVTIIGYDDNFAKENFPEDVRPEANGAFLIKNSAGPRYDWLSYEYNYGNFGDVFIYDFVPASGVLYDNNYFYDGGVSGSRNNSYSRFATRFQCKQEAEKVTAASVIVAADVNNVTVKVYKVTSTKTNLNPISEVMEKKVNLFNGLNFIEFDRNEFFEVKKDELFVVEIVSDEKIPMRVDTNNTLYQTTVLRESFRYDYTKGVWISPSNLTYRIKAITSDTFKITYDSNGGEGSMMPSYVVPGEDIKIKENAFTRNKYEFIGWKDSDGNFYENEGDITNINKNITLYAQWNEIFIITFDGNGGTGTMSAMEIASGSSANIKDNEFVRDLYEIDRWRDSDGNYHDKNGSITPKKDLTLYVEWKRYEYVVSFNSNGGSGTMAQFRVRVGSSANIPENAFTRNKYEFIGWKDGSGVSYDTTIAPTDDITLYAQWNEIFIITFNGNGGTGTMSAMEIASGSSANIKDNEFVRDLYEIDRWRDSDGNYHDKNGSITPKKDLTLYVEWKRYEYVVSFNSNGGSGTMAQFRVRVGSSANIPENAFTRNKYEFIGWKDGSGVSYDTTITPTDDITLYAQWNEIFIITFNGNGGTGTMSAMEIASGSSANIKDNEFVRDLYEIDRWRDSEGNYHDKNGSITPKRDLTLYVEWKRYEYVVSFNNNGGSGTMAQFRVRVGSSANIPENAFTRNKYEFIGWKDGSGVSYDTTITPTDDITLYAQWLRTHYSVSYSPNGGKGSMPEQLIATGSSVTISSNSYTRSNYSFVNWKSNTGVSYNQGDNIIPTDDMLLYAQWRYIGKTSPSGGNTGGSSGGGTIRLNNVIPNVDYQIESNVSNSEILLGAWSKNEENNKWRLYYLSYDSSVETAVNGFYKIISETADEKHINEYLFDKEGYMVTGIVADDKGNSYYMEDEPTMQMGMKVVGWKKKGDFWYCMDQTGLMYKNTTTPDGYYVDSYGRWQDGTTSSANGLLVSGASNNNVIVSKSAGGGGGDSNQAIAGYPIVNSASGGGNVSEEELLKSPEVINMATAIALMNTPDGNITVPQVLTIAKTIVANYLAASSNTGENNSNVVVNNNSSASAVVSNNTGGSSNNSVLENTTSGAASAINFGAISSVNSAGGGSSVSSAGGGYPVGNVASGGSSVSSASGGYPVGSSASGGGSTSSDTIEGSSSPTANSVSAGYPIRNSASGGGSGTESSGPITIASSKGSSSVINTMN